MGYNEVILIVNASAIFIMVLLAMLLLAATKFRGENAYAAAFLVITTIPVYLYNASRSLQWYAVAELLAPLAFSVNTILMPLLWLFVYRNFNQQFRFGLRQCLHFIPAIALFAIYAIHIFSLPDAQRFDFMIYENSGDDTWIGDVNSAIVFIQMFVYFTMIFVYLRRVKKIVRENFSEAEWVCKLWIRKFVILLAGLSFLVFLGYMVNPRTDVWLPQILNVIALCYLVYNALDVSKIPQSQSLSIDNVHSGSDDKSGSVSANPEQLKEYAAKVLEYLQTTQAYTNPNLSLRDLSAATGISYNNLSKAINTIFGKTFFETINQLRIEKAKSLLPSYKENNYTLDTLAEQCGFNSRVIFSNAFKRITGMTTSQWLQAQQNK